MIHRHLRSFHVAVQVLIIFSCVSVVFASPIEIGNRSATVDLELAGRDHTAEDYEKFMVMTEEEDFVGYRVVKEDKAEEYDAAGTLTAIPATFQSTGPGAYVSPRHGMYPFRKTKDLRVCPIIGKKAKLRDPKLMLFIKDDSLAKGEILKLLVYVHRAGYEMRKTLLFSRYMMNKSHMQLVIPPFYLEPSPSNPKALSGKNLLGLRVKCFPFDALPEPEKCPAAKWEDWGIHDWPTKHHLRRDDEVESSD
ncbi:hypothetical protein GYMLUDRAFT_80703 [Collybiopsis luxurians FD-317 M1]|nr:hypothetical protein GYMLUDRAFT_80703 [Collybiopsis luxurians FD-317 M1]